MTGARTGPRRRIAVVAPNWLGDAVMALPAIARLGADAPLAVLAPRYTARVFWRAPGVDEIWIDPPSGRLGRIRSRTRALRAYGAAAAVVLPPSGSSALAPWLAGVPTRVGYATDGRRALLTVSPPAPPRTHHLSLAYLALAASVRALPEGPAPAPSLHVSDADRASVAARLRAAGVVGSFVVAVPGAAFGPAKAWPAERYRALCADLARDVAVVVTGGAADRSACEQVAAGTAGAVNVAGETTLGEFFALAERAAVVVANDSGAPHVSAALGTPTVVLFGSTSPRWTAPLGDPVEVVQHVVHCNPCFRRSCPTQLECFHGIAVADVVSRVRGYLAHGRALPGTARKPFAPSGELG